MPFATSFDKFLHLLEIGVGGREYLHLFFLFFFFFWLKKRILLAAISSVQILVKSKFCIVKKKKSVSYVSNFF